MTQATRSTLMSVDSTLSENITAAQNYIPIASTTNFSTSIVAEIETTNEVVSFDSITTNRVGSTETFEGDNYWKISFRSVTIDANAGVAPDETTTADKVIPTTDNVDSHFLYHGSLTSDNNNTYSLFAKPDGYNFITLMMLGAATTSQGVQFNVSTGAIVASQNATGTITDAGNGWYRCSIIPTTALATTSVYLQPNDGTTPNTSNYFLSTFAGDGTKGVLCWGAQLEDGTLTGYLPNSSTTNNVSILGLTTVTRGVNGTTAAVATSGDAIQQLPYALSEVDMPIRLTGISVTSDGTGAGRFTLCDKIGTTLCDIDIPDTRIYDLSFGGGILFPNGIYVSNSDNITAYTLYTNKYAGAAL